VDSTSGAAKAGLVGGTGTRSRGLGDVIVSIDGHRVKNFTELANYIDSKNVGDKVELKLVRDGKEVTVNLTLDAWQGCESLTDNKRIKGWGPDPHPFSNQQRIGTDKRMAFKPIRLSVFYPLTFSTPGCRRAAS